MVKHLRSKREHTLFITEKLPLFDALYGENTNSAILVKNRYDTVMKFLPEYRLSEKERIMLQTLVSLSEDNFNYFYAPSYEPILRKMSIERQTDEQSFLYIYTRKYGITHMMTDEGKIFF